MITLRLGWAGIALASGICCAHAGSSPTLVRVDAGGGVVSAPVAHGDYLYVGTGSTIGVWDMAIPSNPVYAGRTSDSPAPGPLRGLSMVGDFLYAAWNSPAGTGGLLVYSLSDPAHPVQVAAIDDYVDSPYKNPQALATSGHYVYLGDSENGLIVFDAADPLAPAPIGVVQGVHEFDAMATFGNQLLTTGNGFIGRSLNVLDITDPAAPVFAGGTSLDSGVVLRAALTDGYGIGVGNDMVVYDLHDPSNIGIVFQTKIDQATGAIRSGDALYLVGDSGIQVWDFATPSMPTLLRTVAMPTFAPDQAALTSFGPLILTHTDRGILLDTTDPLQPTLAANFILPIGVNVHSGAFDANHAYFAEEGYGLGVADGDSLAPVGRHDFDLPADLAARDFEAIAVDGGRAYLGAWGFGVMIADVADPAAPVALGSFEFPFIAAIEAQGDRVYASSTTNGGFFKIIDVADPSHPVQLGSLATSQTYDLAVRGDYAYLADGADFGDGGLRVVDISDPTTPVVVGQDTGCPYALGVDVTADGNTTYIACASDASGANALRIVDTTDKTQPTLLGSIALPGIPSLPDYNAAHSVVVVDGIAYVGNEFGLDEVDVSNPTAPFQTYRHDTAYFVGKVRRAPDGRVFAFALQGGTYVFAPVAGDPIFANGFD